MIYVLYGDDDYSRQLAVDKMKAKMGDPTTASLNITTLDGDKLTLGDLQSACDAMPFLAEKRLVMVRRLLGRFEPRKESGGEGGGGESAKPKKDKDLEGALKAYLPGLPATTGLVFLEDHYSKDNPFFGLIAAAKSYVKEFPPLKGEELNRWIVERVQAGGGQISPPAVTALATFVGDHLRTLSLEIDKLISYTGGARPIQEADVQRLVSAVQEASIFQLVDAVATRNSKRAMALLHTLQDNGMNALYILAMITRQFRILLQVKEMVAANATTADMQSKLHLHPFVLQKGQDQAKNFGLERLEEIYRKLAEVDAGIKRGRAEPELALDMLVVELAG